MIKDSEVRSNARRYGILSTIMTRTRSAQQPTIRQNNLLGG